MERVQEKTRITIKITVFWDVIPCGLMDVCQLLEVKNFLYVKTEAIRSTET
jgi:hypothetical protein